MEFLRPFAREFPFDEACQQIVEELEMRHWRVPGIQVEFREYGSGAQRYRYVLYIRGTDFKLRFGRIQRPLPADRWDDRAAVSDLVIPRKELHVYEDNSGPTFYLYVGDDYDRDRETFMNGPKVNSKLNNQPRTYLKYEGACDCNNTRGASYEATGFLTAMVTGDNKRLANMTHSHRGRRMPILVHDNDLSREYDPEEGEPTRLNTLEVMEEFAAYLKGMVLPMIQAHEIPSGTFDSCQGPESIPVPDSLPPIFTFCDSDDAVRIARGQKDPYDLAPADRYGLCGGGYRLLAWGIKHDGTVPEIANDGFRWCGIGNVNKGLTVRSVTIPGHYYSSSDRWVVRIKPNRANGVYIADHGAYEMRRRELGEAMGTRDIFTNKEVNEMLIARARTIVPITEYQGGFMNPVVLINREIDLNEVELMGCACENN